MVLKQVLSTLEAISSEGFKSLPLVVEAIGDVLHRLRWFIVGLVGLWVINGLIPWIIGLWIGKSLFGFLFLLFR